MSTTITPKVNIDYIDQLTYLDGFHRSGWSHVMQYLYRLHDPDATVYLDTYVDRTFHWKRPDILPYTQPWIGFVHHTFDTQFSSFNNYNLLKNHLFLASLTSCRGLFVFSEHQAAKWRQELDLRGYDIPVEAVVHPTEFVDRKFTVSGFISNGNRKIIQIGAWLRDNYAIYRLNRGKSLLDVGDNVLVQKAALIGRNMDHYFKPNGFFRLFRPPIWKKEEEAIPPIDGESSPNNGEGTVEVISVNGEIPSELIDTGSDDNVCRDVICRDSNVFLNKYVLGAIQLLEDYDKSVVLLPTLSDVDYDDLLVANIVYVKLWDAAAVNTLIECIVRHTPIVINKLPAVVELLGNDYPLYANTYEEAESITLNDIISAHSYLESLDKTMLSGEYFIAAVANSAIYQSL